MAKAATKSVKKKSVSRPVATKSGSGGQRGGAGNRTRKNGGPSAASNALLKLLESPMVADLLAVGAAAALAALAEHRYGSRRSTGPGTKRALKGAVTAAAAAMGRRIATEFDDIKKSAKAKSAEAK